MIVLFTDFGPDDIYVAQMKAVLLRDAPYGTPMLDLLHSVPSFAIRAGAHLLAALAPRFAPGSVFLAVVDPGVGGARDAVVVEADGRRFVGPDNGLLSVVHARAQHKRVRRIVWRPAESSATFHGRDLFAPVAARLAGGSLPAGMLADVADLAVAFGAGDLAEVIHIDHYGNALTGLRAAAQPHSTRIEAGGATLAWARTFSEAAPGVPFWYENSIGLVELALDCGSAAASLGLRVGDPVKTLQA